MKKKPLFPLGQVVSTPGVSDQISVLVSMDALTRHQSGDWGDLCDEDKAENELSIEHGFRIMSSYEYPNEPKFWIITEADRSVTTFLLPEEY